MFKKQQQQHPAGGTSPAAVSPATSPARERPDDKPQQPSVRDEHKKDPAGVAAALKDPNVCFTCLRRVQPSGDPDAVLKAVNRLWHRNCWACCECRKSLVGKRFGADGCYIYCEWDYKRKFFCSVCGNPILDKIMTDKSGLLYHRQCFTQRKVGEDADFRRWMDEFNETTSRPKPPPVPAPAPAAATAPPMSAPVAVPGSAPYGSSAMSSSGPSSPPSSSPSPGGAVSPVTIELLTAQMRELGNPPNPKENPAAYKLYMQKKFAIEAQANMVLLHQGGVVHVKELLQAGKERTSETSPPAVLEARAATLLQQLKDFGRPPNAQENPLVYKDYMLRKYQIEERVNTVIFQLNQTSATALPAASSLSKELAAALKELGKPPTDPTAVISPRLPLSARESKENMTAELCEARAGALLQQMRALGPPPSPYGDPAFYKEYMQRKYQLEEAANGMLAKLQPHAELTKLARELTITLKQLGKDIPVLTAPDAKGGPSLDARVTSLLSQIRELGKPPNAAEDLQAYKDYMQRKYQIEEQANALLLQVKHSPDHVAAISNAMRDITRPARQATSPPLTPKSTKR